ncbi:P1 family peptidase [Taklimakanibacter lacteus]|uniref:P1 family peptidase n=1 Tax=Taklimakanibacter lacteus TaxID=2268456 RepID=UPI000E66388E
MTRKSDGVVQGPRNLISDVGGITIGNAENWLALTGTTVILPDASAVAAIEIGGGAPGSRETALLDAANLVEHVHALILSGGSVFGLDAASSVTIDLAKRGVGFTFGAQPVPCPVVPAAILFDIMNGGAKWPGDEPPYRDLGREALAAATADFALGNKGAGLGALAGQLKGGLGSASSCFRDFTVGALVAVNSVGSCVIPGTPRLWARDLALGDEMGPEQERTGARADTHPLHDSKFDPKPGQNTTIAVVATDATLTRVEAKRLAIMARDGLGRAIRPIHTPFDGDTVFALATGKKALPEQRQPTIAALGAIAADTLTRAIGRALWFAETAGGHPSYREKFRL